ncbi:MAG: putative lipid II flippase FtsW [Pontiellaceae bacterium]
MLRNSKIIITICLILISYGILVLSSASSIYSTSGSSYYLNRQLFWLLLSLITSLIIIRIDYHNLEKFVIPISFITILLLIAVLVPGIGKMVNGSWRWLQIGPMTIQPSEFSKPSILILLSWFLSRNIRKLNLYKYGIYIPFIFLGLFVIPIVMEPDYGTTILISAVSICLIFISGSPLKPLILLASIGFVSVGILIINNPERMGRIFAFLNPEAHQTSSAYQLKNSLIAFSEGKEWGLGFGSSIQKYKYLPEAHTDFIFPIIGEEFGLFLGSLPVLLLYFLLFIYGLRVSRKAKDYFGMLLSYGITLMISFQALLNLLVVTGMAPTKGIALPFISYGGSSLLTSIIMISILLNIAIDSEVEIKQKNKRLFKDKG